jgi:hypothetical protein
MAPAQVACEKEHQIADGMMMSTLLGLTRQPDLQLTVGVFLTFLGYSRAQSQWPGV